MAFSTSAVARASSAPSATVYLKRGGGRSCTNFPVFRKSTKTAGATHGGCRRAFRATSAVAYPSSQVGDLEARSMSELRTLAREKGLRADTRSELISLLKRSLAVPGEGSNGTPAAYQDQTKAEPSSSTPPPSASAVPATSPAPQSTATSALAQSESLLRSKTLAELRVLGRQKGVRGTSKEELVKGILSLQQKQQQQLPSATPVPAAAAPKAKPSPAAPAKAPAKAPAAAAAGSAERKLKDEDEIVKALMELDLGHLRYLAKERGLRGSTKEELVQLLAEVPAARVETPRSGILSSAAAVAAATAAALQQRSAQSSAPDDSPLAPPLPLPTESIENKIPSPPASLDPPKPRSTPAAPSTSSLPANVSLPRQFSPIELERMPLSQLRSIARRNRLPGTNKTQLVASISKAQTATAPPASSTSASLVPEVLPPFQSDLPPGGTTLARQVQPELLQAEIEELKKRLGAYKNKISDSPSSDESIFLRNVLVGGLGLALVPVMLPFAMQNLVRVDPDEEMSKNLGLEASMLLQSMINKQTKVLTDIQTLVPLMAPDAAPEIRATKMEEFCKNVPPTLQSADTEKFCNSVTEIRKAAQDKS